MFYKVLKVIVKPIFYLIFCIKIVHKERLRYEGGIILIANHRSNFDPIFMHLVVTKCVDQLELVSFMANVIYWNKWNLWNLVAK